MYLYCSPAEAILRRITANEDTPIAAVKDDFQLPSRVTSTFALHTIILILRCRSDFYVETPLGIMLCKVFYLQITSTDQTKPVTL